MTKADTDRRAWIAIDRSAVETTQVMTRVLPPGRVLAHVRHLRRHRAEAN